MRRSEKAYFKIGLRCDIETESAALVADVCDLHSTAQPIGKSISEIRRLCGRTNGYFKRTK